MKARNLLNKEKELKALNNEKQETEHAKVTRKKFEEHSKATIGMSKENKKWERIGIDRYNKTVWKGMTEKGKSSKVRRYNINDKD